MNLKTLAAAVAVGLLTAGGVAHERPISVVLVQVAQMMAEERMPAAPQRAPPATAPARRVKTARWLM